MVVFFPRETQVMPEKTEKNQHLTITRLEKSLHNLQQQEQGEL